MITRCGILLLFAGSAVGFVYIVDIKSEDPTDRFFLPVVEIFGNCKNYKYHPIKYCYTQARYDPTQLNVGEPTVTETEKNEVELKGILIDAFTLICHRANLHMCKFYLNYERKTRSITCVQETDLLATAGTAAENIADRIAISIPKAIDYYTIIQNFDNDTSNYWGELLFIGNRLRLTPAYPTVLTAPEPMLTSPINMLAPIIPVGTQFAQ